jgi:hypothetical protein
MVPHITNPNLFATGAFLTERKKKAYGTKIESLASRFSSKSGSRELCVRLLPTAGIAVCRGREENKTVKFYRSMPKQDG